MASLAAQTERADIVIVDDGSTVPVEDLLEKGTAVVLRLPRNQGIVSAINHGVAYACEQGYEFIARMDCDDLCLPERIARQQAYMDANPEVDLLGTRAKIVDDKGAYLFTEGVVGRKAIREKLWDNAVFKHPTFMYRASSIPRIGYYKESFKYAEEYEVQRRIERIGVLDCLEDVLVIYTKNSEGISIARRRSQLFARLRIQWLYFDPREAAAYKGLLRTLVTMLVPASIWSRLSQFYWQRREAVAVPSQR
jgi:glycosyltransferase involved in cell wall biosynthesis